MPTPEPDIVIDNASNPYIAAPGGSSTQTSFYWHSADGGQTYSLLGPSEGHWLCSTGGGDSFLLYDRVNGDLYLTDQQSLASLATGKLTRDGKLTFACFSTPAMTADRPFEAILHPTGAKVAPQVKENGGKPIVYLSWQCNGCLGGTSGSGGGGLAYAWTDDGTHWHAADPGVPADTLVTDQFFESPAITSYQWHGSMVADNETGYVFTALSCAGSCPNGSDKNEVGVITAKPGSDRTDKSNVGQFVSETYRTVLTNMVEPTALFPVLTADSAGTLYLVWVQGGIDDTESAPPSSSWHVYYSYSTDKPDHKTWSAPIRVDHGAPTAATVFPWAAAGDPGKLAVAWLGTDLREHPSKLTATKQWHPFVGISTNASSKSPTFQQDRVGLNASHVGDICLRGTLCGATIPQGNRGLADFISIDVSPDGAAIINYASDANQVKTLPTTLTTGVPLPFTSRQISGPRLIGAGNLGDARFSVNAAFGKSDRAGDARVAGKKADQLDLTGSQVDLAASQVRVRVPVSALSNLASPEADRSHIWWLTVWQFRNKIYFAKAEVDEGGTPTFTAGVPTSYDRPGLALSTVPTLLHYRGGTEVTGSKVGISG